MRNHSPPQLYISLFWHTLIVVLLLTIAGYRFDEFFWNWKTNYWRLNTSDITAVSYLAIAYAVLSVLICVYERWKPVGQHVRLTLPLFILSITFLYIIITDKDVSRFIILLIILAIIFLLYVYFFLYKNKIYQSILFFSVTTVIIIFNILIFNSKHQPPNENSISIESTDINTAFYDLQVTKFSNVIPQTQSDWTFGAISHFDSGYIFGTGDGDLYFSETLSSEKIPEIIKLPIEIPMNRKQFFESVGDEFTYFSHHFRLTDILIHEGTSESTLHVAHHYWNDEKSCVVLRVSEATLNHDDLTIPKAAWKTIFESQPCYAPTVDADWPLIRESGGRLLKLNDSQLIVTVGDHGFNGYDIKTDYVNDMDSSYGKNLLLDIISGEIEILSIGHRNQQGLWIDDEDSIWITEHGPQGGDELNKISKGHLYGWPQETYGTDYGKIIWPLSENQNQHSVSTEPIFSWVPSIGISNLIRIQSNDSFPIWQNDFLIATLNNHALFRIHITKDKVRVVERIALDTRIRDIIEDEDGRIVLWGDDKSIMIINPIISK